MWVNHKSSGKRGGRSKVSDVNLPRQSRGKRLHISSGFYRAEGIWGRGVESKAALVYKEEDVEGVTLGSLIDF